MNDYALFNFYLGDNMDDATDYWQVDAIGPAPLVGEKVRIWTSRDERGNYPGKGPKPLFGGIVTRIEHVFEERGDSAQENHKIHFVEIFMKPLDSNQ